MHRGPARFIPSLTGRAHPLLLDTRRQSSLDAALATIAAAAQELSRAERVAVFLADGARGVLWASFAHPATGAPRQIRVRARADDGCVGRCAATRRQLAFDFAAGGAAAAAARDDPALRQLAAVFAGGRLSAALLQPVLDPATDAPLAVLVALNKASGGGGGGGSSDDDDDDDEDILLDEGAFTRADRDALGVLSIEVADALSARALEVSFASAMSVVAANGANANNVHLAHMMRAQLLDFYDDARGDRGECGCGPDSARGDGSGSRGGGGGGWDGSGSASSRCYPVRGDSMVTAARHGGGRGGASSAAAAMAAAAALDAADRAEAAALGARTSVGADGPPEERRPSWDAFCVRSDSLASGPSGAALAGGGIGGGGGSGAVSGAASFSGARPASPRPPAPSARRLPRQLSLPVQLQRGRAAACAGTGPRPRAAAAAAAARRPDMFSFALDCSVLSRDELARVAFDVFSLSGVPAELGVQDAALRGFVAAVASHYRAPAEVPYHNLAHAVQVLHTAWLVRGVFCFILCCCSCRYCKRTCEPVLLFALANKTYSLRVHSIANTPTHKHQTTHKQTPLNKQLVELTGAHALLSPLEEFVLLIAALCHDLDHDGRSNGYHVSAHSERAQRYNDRSGEAGGPFARCVLCMGRVVCTVARTSPPPKETAPTTTTHALPHTQYETRMMQSKRTTTAR